MFSLFILLGFIFVFGQTYDYGYWENYDYQASIKEVEDYWSKAKSSSEASFDAKVPLEYLSMENEKGEGEEEEENYGEKEIKDYWRESLTEKKVERKETTEMYKGNLELHFITQQNADMTTRVWRTMRICPALPIGPWSLV